LVKIIRKTG